MNNIAPIKDVTKEGEKDLQTVVFIMLIIMCIFTVPFAFFGMIMGGGLAYIFVFAAPIVAVIFFKENPKISLLLTLALGIFAILLCFKDKDKSDIDMLVRSTGVILVALGLQIGSLINSKKSFKWKDFFRNK